MMDDKDRPGEACGKGDGPRPGCPGGRIDRRPDPAKAAAEGSEAGGIEGIAGPRGEDERAAGHVDDPIAAGDGVGSHDDQAGDRSELSAQRGGPVDISPDRRKRRGA